MLVNNIVKSKITHRITETFPLQINESAYHHFGPVEIRVNYFNFLPFNITVVERNGFRHCVYSVVGENATQCDFIVRTTITVNSKALDDVRRVISKMDVQANDDLQIIKAFFIGDSKLGKRTHLGYLISLETRYKQSTFMEEGSELYCIKKDLIISTKSLENASAHPNTIDSMVGNELLVCDYGDANADDYAIRIELVDNLDEVNPKYVYSLGKTICVHPKKDPERLNGVYVTSLQKNPLASRGFKLITTKYDYDEAKEKLLIYNTRSEAEAGGDIATSRKVELEKRTHDNQLLKKDLDEISIKHKRQLDELEHSRKIELTRLEEINKMLERENEHLAHIRELEKSERKDFYEKASQSRKDSVDVLKFLPQLVIGIGALILAFNKLTHAPLK